MAATEPSLLAEVVRRYRLTAALSQEELAERSGLSARAISDLERGLRPTPRLETIRMLAGGLGLTGEQRAELLAAARPELRTPEPAGPASKPTVNAATVNLPVPTTALIGREREVIELTGCLLKDGNRLITLTGPGGIGKTRLALEVARNAAPAFSDGALFVDLAPVSDYTQVASTIARALGLSESGDRPVRDILRTALAARNLLMLIDNFEQVIDAAPLVGDLIAASQQLRILVTSRESLRLRGEREIVVHPLELPGDSGSVNLDVLAHVASVELFVQSSMAARTDFELTNEHAAAVAEICRRVDGLPLAIELAASRIRHFSPGVLLSHLDQRLPLLTGGARDLPARQQTLRDTIAWSYDLLSSEERMLLRWMGVFVGGATLESIETVSAPAVSTTASVLARLSSLVDKSLLRERDSESASPRFAMLELVREFALEQLQECGEYKAARQAHAEHFLYRLRASGSSWATHLHGFPGQTLIHAELDNIRSAFDWFESQHDAGKCALLVDAVWVYYYIHGLFREAFSLGRRSLKLADEHPLSDELLVTLLGTMSTMASVLGDPASAVNFGEQAVERARRLPSDKGLLPLALIALAIAWRDQRRFADAMVYAKQALPAARADRVDEYIEPHVLYHIGRLAYLQNDLDASVRSLDESLSQIRKLGPTETALYTINTLAAVHIRLGNVADAAGLLREGHILLPEGGYRGFWFDTAVLLAAQSGFPDAAVRMLGFYSVAYASMGVEEIPVDPRLEAAIDRLRDKLGAARFDGLYRAGSRLTSAEAEAVAIEVLDSVERALDCSPTS